MEGLRIRIPQLFPCVEDGCLRYANKPEKRCRGCCLALLTRMRQEMATTTFSSEPKIVHCPTLCSDASGGR
jgi:hypothetical protein